MAAFAPCRKETAKSTSDAEPPDALLTPSEVAAMFLPQQREGWEHLADNIGMARLWAGVHYRSEHIHGLRLGRIIAGRLPLPIPITSLAAQAVTVELGIRELGIRELGIRMPIAA